MAETPKAPDFYGPENQTGGKAPVPHGAGRAARLKAAGVPEGVPFNEAWKARADAAFAAGSLEDPMRPDAMGEVVVTEKTVSGHSEEKKAALKLMKEEGISLGEALEQVKAKASKTSRKGKGGK